MPTVFIFCVFIVLSSLITKASCSSEENLLQQDVSSLSQTVKERQFSKDEFHYLNVTRVGTSTVYDIFDCIFECLSNPRCFSFNFASSKGEGGKLWCDLLSCDKYRDFREYNENVTSHHFFTMSPCSSMPCRNGSTCVTNYKHDTFECHCDKGFNGEYCEKECFLKTTGGQCCIIPFSYRGVTYHSCTTVDHHRLWCSLDAIYTENW
ncbi:protein jagged-1-like [Orbicella faveolata]|uniref:protein jagged-1-like n=1 Tax=Orbicella faveolata TaxID=48498 RepID=UPI0009E5FA64|nr:protein jagged-1-like [Orbicella faveolata]